MDASIHGQFEFAANAELLDDYGTMCDCSSVEYVLHCPDYEEHSKCWACVLTFDQTIVIIVVV
jgi:hypothetical protein